MGIIVLSSTSFKVEIQKNKITHWQYDFPAHSFSRGTRGQPWQTHPRQSRQLLWPGIVIPVLWLPSYVYVHDLICKSRWGYRPGQSGWNSVLRPLSDISPNALTEWRRPSYDVGLSKMSKHKSELANKTAEGKMLPCITNSSIFRQWVQWETLTAHAGKLMKRKYES